jgi:hypothetical protein
MEPTSQAVARTPTDHERAEVLAEHLRVHRIGAPATIDLVLLEALHDLAVSHADQLTAAQTGYQSGIPADLSMGSI